MLLFYIIRHTKEAKVAGFWQEFQKNLKGCDAEIKKADPVGSTSWRRMTQDKSGLLNNFESFHSYGPMIVSTLYRREGCEKVTVFSRDFTEILQKSA